MWIRKEQIKQPYRAETRARLKGNIESKERIDGPVLEKYTLIRSTALSKRLALETKLQLATG
jgi:hypothetical protein